MKMMIISLVIAHTKHSSRTGLYGINEMFIALDIDLIISLKDVGRIELWSETRVDPFL